MSNTIKQKTNTYKYDFTFIVAVYNVEEYLRESIQSIIDQQYDFNRIQIVLVDDGSQDDSFKICRLIAEQYPSNVIAVHKENGGVSSARNLGLSYSLGQYISFFDSDDTLESGTLKSVKSFFEKHGEETDIVSIPMMHFDAWSGPHVLNYKFKKGTRVIDLENEYSMIQLSSGSSFINSSLFDSLRFNEKLKYTEDAEVIIRVLMNKKTLGVIQEPGVQYNYRKRSNGSFSAVQSSQKDKMWYTPTLEQYHEKVIELCKDENGEIPKFVQYMLAYDLQWRLNQEHVDPETLSPEEEALYKNRLFGITKYISDDIFLEQKNTFKEQKLFFLQMKNDELPKLIQYNDDIILGFNNFAYYSLSQCSLHLDFCELNEEEIMLEGYLILFSCVQNNIKIFATVCDEVYVCEAFDRKKTFYSLDTPVYNTYGFRLRLKLNREVENYNIGFLTRIEGYHFINKNITVGKFFPISKKYKSSYYINHGWKLSLSGSKILLNSCGRKKHVLCEYMFLKELWKKNDVGSRKAIIARLLYYFIKLFMQKPIWLVSDRIIKGDDNGEAFFRFLQTKRNEVNSYFVISGECADYKRIQTIGRVVKHLSFKHKLLHLLCEYNLSSAAENITRIPFEGYHDSYRDILSKSKFVFLQHGVTKDDVSSWLNRFEKNIHGFVTVAENEYNSILNGDYHYTEKNVWLTGFPRYDLLHNNEKRLITIMPTWRRHLMAGLDPVAGIWRIGPEFYKSSFYSFYNKLLNDEELIDYVENHGYCLAILMHPNMQPYVADLRPNNRISIFGLETEYRHVFASSKLIITDYSSTAFDFAYLRKPIIYAQFDKDLFFNGNHAYTKGYFDYEENGFGEVEKTEEALAARIKEYVDSDCALKSKYRKRIDDFFAFNDTKSSERLYDRLKQS